MPGRPPVWFLAVRDRALQGKRFPRRTPHRGLNESPRCDLAARRPGGLTSSRASLASGAAKSDQHPLTYNAKYNGNHGQNPSTSSEIYRRALAFKQPRRRHQQPNGCRFSLVCIREGICLLEDKSCDFEFCEIHGRSVLLDKVQGPHERAGDSILRKRLQCPQVVVPVHRRNYDPALARRDQFRRSS